MDELTVRLDSLTRTGNPLFFLGEHPVTLGSLVSFGVILLLTILCSHLLQRGLRRVYARHALDVGIQYALNRLLHYAIIAIGAVIALDTLGISMAALAGIGAVLAVGIGFGLQNITQNFVSGLILLLERPVKKGDFVEVGRTRGVVRAIHARATLVTTIDGVDIVVPNGQFITEAVVNQTLGSRFVRARVEVGVAYGSDTELVRRTLERVATEHPQVMAEPAPSVLFTAFGESSLDFALLAWITDPVLEPQVTSDLRFAIDRAFRAAGIAIPFPQRDVHLRTGLGDREQVTGNR